MRHRSHPLAALLATTLVALSARGPSSASAEPLLRVRAATRIDLHATHAQGQVVLEATLRDDIGAAIAEREVELRAAANGGEAGAPTRARSDALGIARVTLGAANEHYALHASFEGDDYYERSDARLVIDPALEEVQLALSLADGTTVHLGAEPVAIEVRARSLPDAAGLALVLSDELGRELARGRTDANGRFAARIEVEKLGAPSVGKLVVTSAGDARRAPARAELAILRKLDTDLQLTAAWSGGSPGSLEVSGTLHGKSTANVSLANKAIALVLDGAPFATLATDASGAFHGNPALPPRRDDAPRELALYARFDPDAPWLGESRSATARIELPDETSLSSLWLALPVLVSIALAAWLSSRSRPLAPTVPGPRAAHAGVQRGTPKRRAANDLLSIDGRAFDSTTGLPLTAARVRLKGPDETPIVLEVDEHGSFRSAVLAPGSYMLEVEADGYAAVRAALEVPHAGTASNLRVALASLRGLALDAHGQVAERIHGNDRLARQATPRDTLERLARSDAAIATQLEPLTDHVEQVAFGAQMPSREDLSRIEAEAVAIVDELDRASPNNGSARSATPRWER